MISAGFLQAAGALIGISLLVGALVWLFERRHNYDFGGTVGRGLGASIWWSAEAMTQASTGHRGPITIAGRALAIIWMVVSIITIAVFTASVTSALTTRQMRGLVNGVEDLPNVRVGTLANSATIGFLDIARQSTLPSSRQSTTSVGGGHCFSTSERNGRTNDRCLSDRRSLWMDARPAILIWPVSAVSAH
ncbi:MULTISPECIES: hypothetical protein [Rhizobium]